MAVTVCPVCPADTNHGSVCHLCTTVHRRSQDQGHSAGPRGEFFTYKAYILGSLKWYISSLKDQLSGSCKTFYKNNIEKGPFV